MKRSNGLLTGIYDITCTFESKKNKQYTQYHLLFQSNSSSAIQHVHIWGTYVFMSVTFRKVNNQLRY